LSKAQILLDLQEIDLTLDRLNKRLTEVKAARRETDEVKAAQAAARQAEKIAVHDRAARKELEATTTTLDTKITQAEQRLYSGIVKNPKELLDLQNDIASLKRQKATLDEKLLQAMLSLEEAEAVLKQRLAEQQQIEAAWRASQTDLAAEQTRLEADITQQTLEQTSTRAQLSASDLALYDQLRRHKSGLAVVEMDHNACRGCGVKPTHSVVQQLRQGDQFARCGNCQRILVQV
jgi:uncharacterized protein